MTHDPQEPNLDPEFSGLDDDEVFAELGRRREAFFAAEFEVRERFKLAFKKAAGDEFYFIDDIWSVSKENFRTGRREIVWCFYCGERPGWQREHKTPRSRGGSDHESNIVRSCRACNLRKGTLTLEEYRERLAEKLGAPVLFAGERLK